MAHHSTPHKPSSAIVAAPSHQRLGFNVDAVAVAIALALAALIRLDIIHHIGW